MKIVSTLVFLLSIPCRADYPIAVCLPITSLIGHVTGNDVSSGVTWEQFFVQPISGQCPPGITTSQSGDPRVISRPHRGDPTRTLPDSYSVGLFLYDLGSGALMQQVSWEGSSFDTMAGVAELIRSGHGLMLSINYRLIDGVQTLLDVFLQDSATGMVVGLPNAEVTPAPSGLNPTQVGPFTQPIRTPQPPEQSGN